MNLSNFVPAKHRQQKQQLQPVPQNVTPPPAESPQRAARIRRAQEAAVHVYDLEQHVEQLTVDLEYWRNKAIGAEEQVTRLLDREQQLLREHDEQRDAMYTRQESNEQKLAELRTRFSCAAKIVVEALAVIDGRALPKDIGDEPLPPDEPMPSVVTKGPINPDQDEIPRTADGPASTA